MTRTTRSHLIAVGHLSAIIETYLAAASRTRGELVSLVGYSESAVRNELFKLEGLARAHRTEERHPQFRSKIWLWHAGPGPTPDDYGRTGPTVGATPRQVTTRTYPTIGRRDPLVSALFGSAA